jgi:hypothetical protein
MAADTNTHLPGQIQDLLRPLSGVLEVHLLVRRIR